MNLVSLYSHNTKILVFCFKSGAIGFNTQILKINRPQNQLEKRMNLKGVLFLEKIVILLSVFYFYFNLQQIYKNKDQFAPNFNPILECQNNCYLDFSFVISISPISQTKYQQFFFERKTDYLLSTILRAQNPNILSYLDSVLQKSRNLCGHRPSDPYTRFSISQVYTGIIKTDRDVRNISSSPSILFLKNQWFNNQHQKAKRNIHLQKKVNKFNFNQSPAKIGLVPQRDNNEVESQKVQM
ncbi:unnamed protein product [Paramecium pentaurelia]|uniref:Transmembrane protein n=1 Tax=Paramecium pentaurelia TaxID=43138 RepID=A0A8S1WGM2_9CILI|nr:unnamed protein product [Paramecium pentaurelia]CAD8187861.1 unnamed protein product [Paramecium pentaurelia]